LQRLLGLHVFNKHLTQLVGGFCSWQPILVH
jgi:hypothetical protein